MKNEILMQEFNKRFKVGDKVKHFKWVLLSPDEAKTGKYTYEILYIGKHTRNGELLVVYRSLDDEKDVWVRPMKEFISEVDKNKYPNASQNYRFELL